MFSSIVILVELVDGGVYEYATGLRIFVTCHLDTWFLSIR